jgi:hypothetical protein
MDRRILKRRQEGTTNNPKPTSRPMPPGRPLRPETAQKTKNVAGGRHKSLKRLDPRKTNAWISFRFSLDILPAGLEFRSEKFGFPSGAWKSFIAPAWPPHASTRLEADCGASISVDAMTPIGAAPAVRPPSAAPPPPGTRESRVQAPRRRSGASACPRDRP